VVVLKDARGEDSLETRIARVNALFDPFGRYVAGARTGDFALNLHPDSGAPQLGFVELVALSQGVSRAIESFRLPQGSLFVLWAVYSY